MLQGTKILAWNSNLSAAKWEPFDTFDIIILQPHNALIHGTETRYLRHNNMRPILVTFDQVNLGDHRYLSKQSDISIRIMTRSNTVKISSNLSFIWRYLQYTLPTISPLSFLFDQM